MPQRNIHRSLALANRLQTVDGLLQLAGIALIGLLALVLLITNGGAG